jgi:hypothetical protein
MRGRPGKPRNTINPFEIFIMMNVLVMTQIRENYGAHDWDGTGECPQMWKCKGGEDYIIEGAPSVEDAEHFVEYRVCSESEYSSEEVISASEVAEDYRTDKEIYCEELAPVRIEWTERFLSKWCRGGWNWLSAPLTKEIPAGF